MFSPTSTVCGCGPKGLANLIAIYVRRKLEEGYIPLNNGRPVDLENAMLDTGTVEQWTWIKKDLTKQESSDTI